MAIIDGAEIARQVTDEVRREVQRLQRLHRLTPGFAVVLVGGDAAAIHHARKKVEACGEAGLLGELFHLSQDASQGDVLKVIQKLNSDSRFHGVLLQVPFPLHLDEAKAVLALNPNKDVDCMHPFNLGLLASGRPVFVPAAALAVVKLLTRSGNAPAGQRVVLCGDSTLIRSLALLLSRGDGAAASVTSCPSPTTGFAEIARTADILVAACDTPACVTADMVKPGAAIIDASLLRIKDTARRRGYRVVGCVDFGPVSKLAGAITPMPGGVGPMTIAALLMNTAQAARLSTGHEIGRASCRERVS
jgi:methylenetetrahydrofolate dehydrogenase (NADP+)/methenyltetrahydrofolate cyclohydrolase